MLFGVLSWGLLQQLEIKNKKGGVLGYFFPLLFVVEFMNVDILPSTHCGLFPLLGFPQYCEEEEHMQDFVWPVFIVRSQSCIGETCLVAFGLCSTALPALANVLIQNCSQSEHVVKNGSMRGSQTGAWSTRFSFSHTMHVAVTCIFQHQRDIFFFQAWVASFERPKMSPQSLFPSQTGLSPYLRFGCLSPRLFYWKLTELYKKVSGCQCVDILYFSFEVLHSCRIKELFCFWL